MMSRNTALILFALIGCTNGDVVETDTDADTNVDTSGRAGNNGVRRTGGTTGERAFAQDFARVHVGQRLFGRQARNEADNIVHAVRHITWPYSCRPMPNCLTISVRWMYALPRQTLVETEAGIARISGTGAESL